MKIYLKDREIEVSARRVGLFGEAFGLMFRPVNTNNLLFEFEKDTEWAIHSWFVFFPFLAVWLDSKNRVMESRIVRPFENLVVPSKPFRKLVELPVNDVNSRVVELLVGNKKGLNISLINLN